MRWYGWFRRFLKPGPVATALTSEVEATPDLPAVPPNSKAERGTILVVAHEPALVESLKHSFHGLCQVSGTTQVGEALRIVENEPIQVALVDQRMPVMPGVEVLRKVLDTKPEVIRLLFGGYADIKPLTPTFRRWR
jgi:DNA-binding NtrC family response regulator